ncbi:MAG TPA: 1,2-phenylacetyl-CoA epoxidase subunit PaaC [Puia sp.]|nr:1,2-phenylacetyl-CoA epoxidase subunit PaaC [Puia sp.]
MEQQTLIDYTLHLADNALVLGHRNSEWTGHGPILEQDIALSNIALDLIGQARNFYQYAARLSNEGEGVAAVSGAEALGAGVMGLGEAAGAGSGRGAAAGSAGVAGVTEDTLAYLRDAWDYRNCLLVEQDNGDWAKTILRLFFFSAYQYYFYQSLQQSRDRELAAIAEKSYKEVTYHLRWSSEWVIRLGDGTEESHRRMKEALDQLWKFTDELFVAADYEKALAEKGIAADLTAIRPQWEERVEAVFQQARLKRPVSAWGQTGGKQGRHTEHLGYLLAEMQFLQRAYPGCEW